MYQEDNLLKFEKSYSEALRLFDEIQFKYLSLKCSSERAQKFIAHGFLRRLNLIKRTIENICNLCPLDNEQVLPDDILVDLAIQYQALIFNVSGCLDNLAWIWALERDVRCSRTGKALPRMKIKLFDKSSKDLNASLPLSIQNKLKDFAEWYKHLEDYRHSLAHRIPLYVPRYNIGNDEALKQHADIEQKISEIYSSGSSEGVDRLREKQEALGEFIPVVTHSFYEKTRPVYFHAQAIANWRTVLDLAQAFLSELES